MSRSARAGTATLTLSVDHAPDGLGGVFVLAAHLIDAGRQCDGIVLLVDEPHRLGAGTHAQVEPSVLLLEQLGERGVDRVRMARRLATGQHDPTGLPRHRPGLSPKRAIGPDQEHISLSVHGHGSPSVWFAEVPAVRPNPRVKTSTSETGARGPATSPGRRTLCRPDLLGTLRLTLLLVKPRHVDSLQNRPGRVGCCEPGLI